MKRDLSHRKNERGSVLAYTVLSALFLFLAVGLGADLSHLYLVKTELQNAADSAALAGASALLLPDAERIPQAVERAVETLNKNKYNFNNLSLDGVMTKEEQANFDTGIVKFAVNLDGPYMSATMAQGNPLIRFVMVDTPTVPVNIFFSIPILGLARDMKASATAGLSKPINVFCNFLPIAVVEGAFGEGVGWMDFNKDGVKDYATDCTPPPPPPVPEGEEAPPPCNPAIMFCAGCKYKMVAGPGDWHDTSPGNYQALDAGEGAKDLKLAIAGGSSMCVRISDEAEFVSETEPGRMTGPILKGLNTRFDDYAGFGAKTVMVGGEPMDIERAFPPDVNIFDAAPPGKDTGYPGINYNDYKTAFNTDPPSGPFFEPPRVAHRPGRTERREVTMPIINENQFEPGKDDVKFTRFGTFFMNRKVGGIPSNPEIYVEFLGLAKGSGGLDPDGGPTAPIVVPVLYR
ncbi:MAG TPA: pilus assembly protein TadG-related protein [Pyrinomonadaceae bacterium]|nr:pilus assembly protein TadG-related protein [Pyrinomonadaceae bacterium]